MAHRAAAPHCGPRSGNRGGPQLPSGRPATDRSPPQLHAGQDGVGLDAGHRPGQRGRGPRAGRRGPPPDAATRVEPGSDSRDQHRPRVWEHQGRSPAARPVRGDGTRRALPGRSQRWQEPHPHRPRNRRRPAQPGGGRPADGRRHDARDGARGRSVRPAGVRGLPLGGRPPGRLRRRRLPQQSHDRPDPCADRSRTIAADGHRRNARRPPQRHRQLRHPVPSTAGHRPRAWKQAASRLAPPAPTFTERRADVVRRVTGVTGHEPVALELSALDAPVHAVQVLCPGTHSRIRRSMPR